MKRDSLKKKNSPAITKTDEQAAETKGLGARESCVQCEQPLETGDRALFVEEEVGRIFCSEKCIVAYFGPEIERLEHEYAHWLSDRDLPGPARDELSHLRWDALADPIEVWRQKTLAGDQRYTFISEFEPSGVGQVWCICLCLVLRDEPSFLYVAVITRDRALLEKYRRGEP